MANDPRTIDKMISTKQNKENTNTSSKSLWLTVATVSVMNKSHVSTFCKKLKSGGTKKVKPVDRLKKDKLYLEQLGNSKPLNPEDMISSVVAASAKETILFLKSRERFWTQASTR